MTQVSALEFAAAIKWPITVLILAALATVALKRNPGTRKSMATWLQRRNLRLHLAGQEFEATLAETQAVMDVAAGSDQTLADTVVDNGSHEGEGQTLALEATPAALELARRAAVEEVVRNAVRLGWRWGQERSVEPNLTVWWNDEGHPNLFLSDPSGRVPRGYISNLARTPPEVASVTANEGARRLVAAMARHSREMITQQESLRDAIRESLRRDSADQDQNAEEPRSR